MSETSLHSGHGPAPPLVFTYPEAAARLRISKSSLRLLVDSGEIAAIRIGRSVRFADAELRRYVAQQLAAVQGASPFPGSAGGPVKRNSS